jgi:3-hydroxy-9,10-secoandrosta-1,3,5(10)-triene-9,17-dione monooxygenase reductase component
MCSKSFGDLENTDPTCYKGRVLHADDFRRVLGHFASGVTVVTTCDADGHAAGLTASAFTSVSLHPPLVLVCVAHASQSYPALRASGRFAVNVLAADQEAISRRFATSALPDGADKFEGIAYRPGALGLPLLEGALGHVECSTVPAYPGGDHTIFVGQVEAGACGHDAEAAPLLYYRGQYSRLGARGEPV